MDFSTQSKIMPVLSGIDKVNPSIGIGPELTIVGQWSQKNTHENTDTNTLTDIDTNTDCPARH